MEDRATFTNKEKALSIYKWTLRKYIPFSIAYWILLFISFPMVEIFAIIVQNSTKTKFSYYVNEMKEVMNYIPSTVFAGIAILFSAIITIMAFSYMHNKRCVDFFGSFPVSRRTLFFSRYFAVITASIIPIVVFGIIGAALGFSNEAFIIAAKIIGKLILIIIGNISFISFISLCCGTVADVIISYGIINIVYPICVAICYYFPGRIIPGLDSGELPTAVYTLLCPVAAIYTACFGSGAVLNIAWWIALSIVLMAGCYRFSKKRKAETAQNAFAFAAVEIVIKFITCFTAGMGCGWVLAYGGGSTGSVKAEYIWFAIGFVAAVMVANVLLHLIFHRGLSKYKKSLVECGAVVATGAVFVLTVTTGAFGYDDRIPDREDIKEVTVKVGYEDNFVVDGEDLLAKYTDDEETIDTVVELHSKIVERGENILKHHGMYAVTGDTYLYDYADVDNITIVYRLKNGKTMTRHYSGTICRVENYSEDIKKIQKSDMRADEEAMLNRIPEKYLNSMEIGMSDNDGDWSYSYYLSSDKDAFKELLQAVKKDVKEKGVYEFDEQKNYFIRLEYWKNEYYASFVLRIPEEYSNTRKVLKDTGCDNIEYNYMKDYYSEFESIKDVKYSLGDNTIYFEVPDSWDKNLQIRCMLRIAYDDSSEIYCENFLPIDSKFLICDKVSDNVWKYTIPEIEDEDYPNMKVMEVVFYQYSKNIMNYTGTIELSGKGDNNLLMLKEKLPEEYDGCTGWENEKYKYEWKQYK